LITSLWNVDYFFNSTNNFFSIDNIDNDERRFYSWEFLNEFLILLRAENERSANALEAGIVNINEINFVACGKFSSKLVVFKQIKRS
jgi:hypothetical protein